MFAIEVVRFDAQDVIATSSTCPAAVGSLHVYVQNGTYTVYEYDGENFKKSSITNLGTKFNNAAANSAAGWYAYSYNGRNAKIGYNGDNTLAGKCDDSLYHPIQ